MYSFKGRVYPRVAAKIKFSDRLGGYKVRWGINRMGYLVPTGLYAIGTPDANSPVFVSANYRLSFDTLRRHLVGVDGWILVLDTKGVNVWCAAGKGTFGTRELLRQIEIVKLAEVIDHNKLIVPQLGATGISAHDVKNGSGFRVVFGPVRASDIGEFLAKNMQATPDMRKVTFPLYDRLILTPVEFVASLRLTGIILAVLLILSGLSSSGYSFHSILAFGVPQAFLIIGIVLVGVVVFPLLLPWIPGRPFALKGILLGIAAAGAAQSVFPQYFTTLELQIAWFCIFAAGVSYLGMNFTGSSTYTSLSGVLKEMKYALPAQITLFVIGSGLWIADLFFWN